MHIYIIFCLFGIWATGIFLGYSLATRRSENERYEAQRLRDEAWDLMYDVNPPVD